MTSIGKPDSLISDLLLGSYLAHKEKHELTSPTDEGDVERLHVLLPWMSKDEISRRLICLRKSKPGWLSAGSTLAAKLAAPKPIKLDINSLPRATGKKDSAGSEAASSDRTDRKSMDSAAWETTISPKITIHVCDEGKGLKQDFECPKDLLVQEMKYFADYLSSDQQKWEDVDISVHCDVNIFDWLMRYVKRGIAANSNPAGSLEPTNVVSILISSDFLKMDNLVDLCIGYCHHNMSAILATPCNMSCLSDALVDRIAERFTDCEVDDVRDKKDKIKSALFQKKIEALFSPASATATAATASRKGARLAPSARTLFRCRHCQELLTRDTQRLADCRPSRLCVGPAGAPTYRHEPDASFDVNEFLVELKRQLGSWRGVYWRLWGLASALDCARCGRSFQCAQLGHCVYHPSEPRFEALAEDASTNCLGVYPCCGVKTLRFDPFRLRTGCKFRDHVISTADKQATDAPAAAGSPNSEDGANDDDDDPDQGDATAEAGVGRSPVTTQEILLAKRDVICVPPPDRPVERSLAEVDILGNEYLLLHPLQKPPRQRHKNQIHTGRSAAAAPVLEPLCVDEERSAGGGTDDASDDSGEDDYDGGVGDTDVGSRKSTTKAAAAAVKLGTGGAASAKGDKRTIRNRVTLQAGAILLHAPTFTCKKSGRWDANRSSRANQDYQRQDDRRRMSQIMEYLVTLRASGEHHKIHQPEKSKQKEYSGGMYAKLEAQFKATHSVSAGANKVPPMNPSLRAKAKLAATTVGSGGQGNSAGLPFR